MSTRRPPMATAALLAALLLAPTGAAAAEPPTAEPEAVAQAEAAVAAAEPEAPAPTLTLAEVLALAEANNPGLRLAQYQVAAARNQWATAPAQAVALAPAAALFVQMQYGVTLPQNSIAPQDAARQAQISFEDAVAQYYNARQQVRLGGLQAYVEWQKAAALVAAQEGALARAETQAAQVRTAFTAGAVAKLDLLQAEAQVAGQKAALSGARAMLGSVRFALEQVTGQPLPLGVQPSDSLTGSAEVVLNEDLPALVAKAMKDRPDLRQDKLQIVSRRMLGSGTAAAVTQLQVAATQYEMSALKAQAEVGQALEACRGALAELKAREQALDPAREALRLSELRYNAGLGTYLEVQSSFASALQADAARIQAAANLAVQLAKLAQATGDL